MFTLSSFPWTLSQSQSDPNPNRRSIREVLQNANQSASFPPSVLLTGFALGALTTVSGGYVYRRFFRRIKNGDWITPDVLVGRRWIKGVVTRLYHTPGLGWRWPLKFRKVPLGSKDLKDQTIHIRLAGVDAPEAAHFGRPAQPYAEESLAWLKNYILGKTVYCQLVRRDQYGRIVAVAVKKPRILPGSIASGKSVSLEMLLAGWVVVYEQAGAEYGTAGKDEFLRAEAQARASRKGMWSSGTSQETPAEFKRRYARSAEAAEQGQTNTKPVKRITWTWFSKFIPWMR